MNDTELLQQISDLKAWLAEVEAKLMARQSPPPTETVDEAVAAATSVTAVHKALERELGVDRRTILSRVERVVLANGIADKVPGWQTDVAFAKYLAARMPSGRVRLVEAIAKLDGKVAA